MLEPDRDRAVHDAILSTHLAGANSRHASRNAYPVVLAKWATLCPAVARSLEEAGTGLLDNSFNKKIGLQAEP